MWDVAGEDSPGTDVEEEEELDDVDGRQPRGEEHAHPVKGKTIG